MYDAHCTYQHRCADNYNQQHRYADIYWQNKIFRRFDPHQQGGAHAWMSPLGSNWSIRILGKTRPAAKYRRYNKMEKSLKPMETWKQYKQEKPRKKPL